ncbi:MAG: HAD family hydrolase [Candidatus Omnitrophica bacterium]|nr:HAD family hydrolase [Candidatus Omnitrophota bacterium]
MKRFKLIIFDLDGTLIDAYAAITKSFNFAMKRFGYPQQSRLVIRRAVGWGDTHLLRFFVKAQDVAGVLETYRRDHKTSLVKYSKVFPGVIRLLAGLKAQGYKLAVASNRPTRFSLILIRHLRLSSYFDYVLCADKLKAGKPHPEILRQIIAKFSLRPSDTLYVGDMVIDAQAGRRARVKTVIVTTGSSSIREIKAEKPWKIIKKIKTLSKLIDF